MKHLSWFSSRPTLMFSLMPLAIAINLTLQFGVNLLKLPLFLDSVGTALMGALFGGIPGALTGVISNVVAGLTINPVQPWFAGTAAVIGIYAAIVSRRGWLDRWWKAALAGLLLGVITAAISAPIATYVFGGVTPTGAYSLIVAYARATGRTILESAFLAGAASDPVDKLVTFLMCFSVISALPGRLRVRFPLLEARRRDEPSR